MDARRYERVRAVFSDALDQPRGDRDAFVASACAGDAELQGEVLSLLARSAEEEPGSTAPGRRLRSRVERVITEAESDSRDAADTALPERIGPYDVVRCLGEGGMGIVYEAEQRTPRRRVAVKILRPGHGTRAVLVRFRREAELLGRLQHPGIARVYDAGEARPWGPGGPEVPYLAMELVDGTPLTAHATRRGLNRAARLELMAKVCDAVQHAHERGVVHRDLKPANVLVDESGQPRVLDFGVARALDADVPVAADHTGTSELFGTLPYMSPEQLGGDSSRVGAAADIYTLGVLTYELLAGRRPIPVAGLSLVEAARHVKEVDPPRLGSIDPALAGDVEAIVGKAMEKDPERRYGTATEMAADIRRHLAEIPILARPPSAVDRARKFARRNRTLVVAACAVGTALLIGAAVSTTLAVRAARARREAEIARAEARRESYRAHLAAALAALADGDAPTALRHLTDAPQELREWSWKEAEARLDDSLGAAETEVRKDATIAVRGDGALVVAGSDGLAVVSRSDLTLTVVGRRSGDFSTVSVDGRSALEQRDGRWLLHDTRDLSLRPKGLDLGGPGRALAVPSGGWITWRGTRMSRHDKGGTIVFEQDVGADAGRGARWAVSPDGARVAIAGFGDLRVVTTAQPGGVHAVAAPVNRVIFTPDGRRLLASDEEGGVRCRDADALEPCVGWDRVIVGPTQIAWLRVADMGSRFLTIDWGGRVRLWNAEDGAPLGTIANVAHRSARAFFSPGGSVVLVPQATGALRAFSAVDGRALGAPQLGHRGIVTELAFSPDGRLASVDNHGELRLFGSTKGGGPRQLLGHAAFVYSVDVNADGTLIASVAWDGTVRLWDARSGAIVRTLHPPEDIGRALRFSPDGKRLVTAHDHVIVEWDVVTGAEVARMTEHGASDLAFDDSGSRLALCGGDNLVEVWKADLSERLLTLPSAAGFEKQPAAAVALGRDGRLFVALREAIAAFDASDGRMLWRATNPAGAIHDLAKSPDGTQVAAATQDGGVTTWDVATGAMVRRFGRTDGQTLAVAWHPSGTMIATGSFDGAVETWDATTGDPIARLYRHDDYVRDLAFSPDGTFLVSGSGDATVHVMDTKSLRERLAAAAAR